MRLRTHRTRTRFAAAGTAVAAFLATLAGLIGVSAAPAGAGTNGTTTYEADCTTSLQAGVVAPFVQGLNANGAPDPSFPTGATFGASGASSSTVIGPVVAGIEQALNSPNLGMAVNEVVGSTDGTATGSFSYVHDFGSEPAAPARQIAGGAVTYTAGSTTLSAPAGTFSAGTDIGLWVAGPSGQIDPQTTITAVSALGDSATISIPTLAASTGGAIGLGRNVTRADAAFSTGNVFTTNGVNGGKANIGVTAVNSVIVHALIDITFGGATGSGVGPSNCLLTGFDAANNPGPAQQGALAPALPPGTVTPLVAASGGFISQPGTTQMITPPAAAFVSLADAGPVTTDTTATIDRNTANTTTLTLPATDGDATGVASCSAGSPSDPRLSVSVAPNSCQATLTDSGGASTGATVTFPFTAVDTAGNPSTPAAGSTVTVTITPIPHVAITTSSLPNAAEGQPYTATLAATGGTTPYSWSASGLPSGLSVNSTTGVISGTPDPGTAAGSPYSVGVMVTDSDSPAETATATLSLTVTPPPVADGAMNVIVSGPVKSAAGSKTVVGKVTNTGTTSFQVCDTDISWVIDVAGQPTGSVAPLNPGCSTLGPGGSHRFRFSWTHDAIASASTVDFTGTVAVAGDPTPADNTDTETRTSK